MSDKQKLPNEYSGLIFPNHKKVKEKQPDYKGKAVVNNEVLNFYLYKYNSICKKIEYYCDHEKTQSLMAYRFIPIFCVVLCYTKKNRLRAVRLSIVLNSFQLDRSIF